MRFYLGTHKASWLNRVRCPLFLSRRTLSARRSLPAATCDWALDSGGFTELSLYGGWVTSQAQYVDEAYRFQEQIGRLRWAAIQDWMCEPFMLEATGCTVEEHQERTINSYLSLKDEAPDIPWIPILQGWDYDDYMSHMYDYLHLGVDLENQPAVGIGSVCRRQATGMVEELTRDLHQMGLPLHGFGFKIEGIRRCAPYLASADSMAWSFDARRSPPLPGHTHKSCANCLEYATRWRDRVQRIADQSSRQRQGVLF